MSSSTYTLQLARGISRRRQQQPNTTRRLLSSLGITPIIPATLPPKRIGALVSRRQWNKLYQKPPRTKTNNTNPVDEKPWPRSVQILGYALGTTVVPYVIMWYIATNVVVRTALEPYIPGMMPFLRKLYGEPEEEAVSYVDKRDQGKDFVMPLILVSEPSSQRRREQEALEVLMDGSDANSNIPTRLRVYTHGGFNLGEVMDLPGNLPVTQDALVEVLMKDRDRSVDPESVSHVTVEFSNLANAGGGDSNNSSGSGEEGTLSGDPVFNMPSSGSSGSSRNFEDSLSDLAAHVSYLTRSTGNMSFWHYQPGAAAAAQQQSVDQTGSNGENTVSAASRDELRASELEYEIDLLTKQLKDHTTMRNLDDLNDELGRAKSELRRLRWKKRLPFLG